MAPVKLKEVIVYSSQDPVHRADNLLQEQSSQWKRWLCVAGDRSGTMQAEFQLEKAARIGYIDIGNYGSAFVEVLVRKSSWSSSQYVTLIPATMLMSPMESRTGQNKCVVKMFSKASLSEESLKEEWDRIKVICSQPYKKDAQFGLAFIRLRSLEEQKQANQSVSPGPTMTKLHSKTESPPSASTNRSKGRTVLSPSWKTDSSFQRQFVLGNDGSNKYGDVDLKSRLLKMASTADAGSDKSDSLSRSAKMVLASANGKESTPKRQTGSHGNDIRSPPLNNRSDGRDRSRSGSMPDQQDRTQPRQRQSDSDIENYKSPAHRDERNRCIQRHGNKDAFANISPKGSNCLESKSKRYESPGGDRQRSKETLQEDARRPAKRPSNSLPETSPTKTRNTDSNTPFKQLAEDLLKSFGHRLVESKLSDIRPVLERKLKRKLSKQEKKTLKELAVQRVDFLILKTKSSPAPPSTSPTKNPQPQPKEKIAKPQTQRRTSSSAVGVHSSSLDDAESMEFRSCHKCYLNFTARQITGHVITCQGIKSAGSITMATSAFSADGIRSSPKRGRRRGRGRGRGGGGGVGGRRGRRSSSPVVDATPSPLTQSHIRTVQMPSYQGNGAVVAKRKGKGQVSSGKSSATREGMEAKPGGFVADTTGASPPESPNSSVREGAFTNTSPVEDVGGFTSCPICQESFPSYVIEQHADLCLERNMILTEMANQQMVCV